MQYVKFGNTGMDVSRICLGMMSFGKPGKENGVFPWAKTYDEGKEMFKKAVELGINYFDTANVYQMGTSEEITGRFIKDFGLDRDEIVVATKVKPHLHTGGYLQVNLGRQKKFKIHRLVAEMFLDNPLNLAEVDHIHGIKMDNYFKNLRWVTVTENNQYAYDTNAKQSKFNEEQVRYIRKVYKPYDKKFGQRALAKKFGVSQPAIRAILNHKTYKNVE